MYKNIEMSLKNLSSQRNNPKKIGTEFSRDFYKGSFENKDKFFLNDSEFIENYNNSLKSPQSRRLYKTLENEVYPCLLYTSPSPRDGLLSRMPSSA